MSSTSTGYESVGRNHGSLLSDHICSEKAKQAAEDKEKGTDMDQEAASSRPFGIKVGHSDEEMVRRQSLVQGLARSLSHASDNANSNPFIAGPNSPLNPTSTNFSARQWAKTVLEMMSKDGSSFCNAGVCFQNVNVHGYGDRTDYQKNAANVWLSALGAVGSLLSPSKHRIDILRGLDGVVHHGEMLVVLGPPGSGCSTFLKTVAGCMSGIFVNDGSYFNYQGITAKEMQAQHRGETIYTAETDAHFPQLTVGDTLTFASRARQPRRLPSGLKRGDVTRHLRDVVMAMFGISHTVDTRVGNEYIRGVSGGERKRVTISEAALSGAPLQCWDNSTRGLDSANAIEFCKTLRLQAEIFGYTSCVSIYQSPQSAYDLFDKALVLYEGRQIYFGFADAAKEYFINLGFDCPARQTTPDFLTSMTSPLERIVRLGLEGRVPNTPDDFAMAWKTSDDYRALQLEIEQFKTNHPLGGLDAEAFRASKQAQQAKGQRKKSPFTLSYGQQIRLCLWRGWRRLVGDPSLSLGALIGNFAMSLIIGSIFYDLTDTTSSFFQRGALIFFACLMNAFASSLEILTLYAQRPVVEKHSRYALYHPSAEAISSLLCDMPYKICNAIVFNVPLYFMTNLRREPGAFFYYLLVSFTTVMVMSMMFRFIGSASRTLFQALVPAALLIIALVSFTGFVLPTRYMLGWCKWLSYIDPLAYAFEALMANEFHGRQFRCSEYVPSTKVPGYENVDPESRVCSSVGSLAGQNYIDGDVYLRSAYGYEWRHAWRNWGVVVAFTIFFLFLYMMAAEVVSEKKSKGEVLVYRRGKNPTVKMQADKRSHDVESATPSIGPIAAPEHTNHTDGDPSRLQRQTSVFQWHNVCYEVHVNGKPRQILDRVDGWVKPGTLTALMGVSGAGKTTLLDCLADRTSMGIVSGDMLVDGRLRDASFQRKTGYVQQQDLHLQTSTVREALEFSAILRQPPEVSRNEKLAYVNEVIKLLDMQDYADAIVGVPGEGLNVEQRKRLTIGVELAAKPPLLLFIDEPTSGLDSQTSWAILDLLGKLAKAGQAILCTIHQPSAMLFQRFDRLLLLSNGGKTVYFGDIGQNSKELIGYFERNGGTSCPVDANPAEWMLQVIGAARGTSTHLDWFKIWRESHEYNMIQNELRNSKKVIQSEGAASNLKNGGEQRYRQFAAPFSVQLRENLLRVFQQYWRMPVYIYAKTSLCALVALFVGFIFFRAPNSIQGLQNQMFAVFQLLTVFNQLVQQSMPQFVIQRDLYEARERPSNIYSWKVFILSQIIVEVVWNSLMAIIMFFCWYYPVGFYRNAADADQLHERGALMFLFLLMFLLFTSTFSALVIAGFETADAGGNTANLMFMLALVFCGVLSTPQNLPRFWIFMYRVSPFTYLVSGMLSVGVANVGVQCADNELLYFKPNGTQTCEQYMHNYINTVGGKLLPNLGSEECKFCYISNTNQYLAGVSSHYDDRWRNFALLWAYIAFNFGGALFVYWLARVPKKTTHKGKVKVALKRNR